MSQKSFFTSFNHTMDSVVPFVTPFGVVLGFVFAHSISWMKPAVTWLFAFITLVGAMGMDTKDFRRVLSHPKPIILSLCGSHVVIPILIWAVAYLLFPGKPEIVTGFVLLFSIPTAVVSYMWSSIFQGNGPLSLTLILIDTVLAPILTPLTIKALAHSSVVIDTKGMMVSLLWMVVLPSVIGVGANTLTDGKLKSNVKPYLNPFTKFALLMVVALNVSQIAGSIHWNGTVMEVLATNIVLIAGGFVISRTLAKACGLGHAEQVSLTFSMSMRNISAALVLAIKFFPPDSSIPVLVGVVLQQSIAALMGKMLFRTTKE